jgi:arylsulfatase A-like enzyme
VSKDLPNVVLAVLDTSRRDRYGCYGYPVNTTPTVDALATDGLVHDAMISNAPWTVPAHGSIFTGLYPTQHGAQWRSGMKLRDSVSVTLAEWMQNIGYETVCATNNGLISSNTGLARGFDHYAFRLELERGLPRARRRVTKALFGGDSGGKIINSWIDRTVPEIRKPLFLFVNYLECHWAYAPPQRFMRQVGGDDFGALEGLRYRATVARSWGPWEGIARADERTLAAYSKLYDGELANADHHLHELLDILERSGRLDGNTIVIATSDHGEHIGEHGLADHHASLSEYLTSVPFVVWGPGIVPSGRRADVSELVDLFPSLCRMLDEPLPAGHLVERRKDLLSREADATSGEQIAFSEWRSWNEGERERLARRNPSFDFTDLGRDLVSARTDRFKLVRTEGLPDKLFDLEADPNEERDAGGEWPEEATRIGQRLDEVTASWNAWERAPEPLSERDQAELEERLSALGYI